MYHALLKVSAGFKLVYYGLAIVVLAVVIAFIGGCVLGAGMAAAAHARGRRHDSGQNDLIFRPLRFIYSLMVSGAVGARRAPGVRAGGG